MRILKPFILILLQCLCIIGTLFYWSTSCAAAAKETLHIEIKGVNAEEKTNILAHLAIDQAAYQTPLSPAALNKFYQNAPAVIRRALEPYGYFQPHIHSHIQQGANLTTLYFFIQPGPPVIITRLDLQLTGAGENNPAILRFIRTFPLKVGQRFNTTTYEKAKADLFDIVNNQGYLTATLEKKEVRIRLSDHSAAISLRMNTGPQYYFGRFTFNPNPFNPEFLRRFITLKESQPFSSEKLLQFQQDLNNSKYFQQVTVSPQLDKAENYHVPTQIDLTAPKAKSYTMGVGYGTYTGPRVTLGVDFRRVTNTGQHFNAQLKYSSVIKGLAAKYFIPGSNPLTEQYTIGANVQTFRPKNGYSFSETLSASYVKKISRWTHTVSLNLLNERYRDNEEATHLSHLLYPSYNAAYLKADDMITPRFGNAFTFIVQGSSEDIASTTSFIQGEVKDKYIFSPTETSRVILRGDLGYTVVNNLNQLPLTLNYFAGGLNSVRGYAYGSLGPGRYLEVASVEYQHRLIGQWNGAVFYDVGNAINHFNDPLMRGVGVGIIYQSVIGAIQVYLARAESKDGKPFSLEFTIGPDF